jgi:hypothetical protein
MGQTLLNHGMLITSGNQTFLETITVFGDNTLNSLAGDVDIGLSVSVLGPGDLIIVAHGFTVNFTTVATTVPFFPQTDLSAWFENVARSTSESTILFPKGLATQIQGARSSTVQSQDSGYAENDEEIADSWRHVIQLFNGFSKLGNPAPAWNLIQQQIDKVERWLEDAAKHLENGQRKSSEGPQLRGNESDNESLETDLVVGVDRFQIAALRPPTESPENRPDPIDALFAARPELVVPLLLMAPPIVFGYTDDREKPRIARGA